MLKLLEISIREANANRWVQQISSEIFDENICSGDVEEIKIHYGNISVMYVTNVNWVGDTFELSLCVSKSF